MANNTKTDIISQEVHSAADQPTALPLHDAVRVLDAAKQPGATQADLDARNRLNLREIRNASGEPGELAPLGDGSINQAAAYLEENHRAGEPAAPTSEKPAQDAETRMQRVARRLTTAIFGPK